MFRKQKSFLAFLLVLEFFVVSVLPASAGMFSAPSGPGGISLPDPSQLAAQLESRFHLNLGSIQNQAENLNVSGNKTPTPEVSFFFDPTDPKSGQKLTAKAFPIYFSNTEETLYYSWYLKHKGCNVAPYQEDSHKPGYNPRPTGDLFSSCDVDNSGDVTVNDWKVAAARILVQNGYDNTNTDYSTDSDDDGYRAKFGGDNKTNVPNYCYVHDPSDGKAYELASGGSVDFGCGGKTPVCMTTGDQINATTTLFGGDSTPFSTGSNGIYYASGGTPSCTNDSPSCTTGTPCCVSNPSTATTCETNISTSSCTVTESGSVTNKCEHLFAQPRVGDTGDGDFGTVEEEFWKTNPQDPSTADNGKKDEANVVGLGQSSFVWSYVSGDQVGVAVEGASMIPTKHDDASYMVMWAFPKNQCYPGLVHASTGAYSQTIKGYAVSILTADMDMNDCISHNLVDPTQGGQATNMEVTVTATPDNPINDETSDKAGDIVNVQATVSNAQHNVTDMLFEWTVEISKDINFNDKRDITNALRTVGLLGNTKGNALDSIRLKLDMPNSITSGYLTGDIGYLRFKSTVTENFSTDTVRKGKSDVIVKFTSTTKKISAYKAGTELVLGSQHATLTGATSICNVDVLDKTACRVIKNEIIGLRIDDSGLSNFLWTVNGAPLTCSKKVSSDCSDTEQNNENFFPVVGNPGDTYTVTVTANDVSTGDTLTLSRTFGVVAPIVTVESLDKNIVWPKLLGQYKDITGNTTVCPNGLCNDYSTSMFESFSGSTPGFRAVFIPGFLANSDTTTIKWAVDNTSCADGVSCQEVDDPMSTATAPKVKMISFTADKFAGGVYTVNLAAQVVQSDDIRRALLDIWGISPFDSPETNFSTTIQMQLQDPGLVEGPLSGPRKYYAAIVSYVPASLLFTFRILLSAVLILFVTGFIYALLEDRHTKALGTSFLERE